MSAGRVLLLIFGAIAALIGTIVVTVAVVGLWASAQRDDDGYFATDFHRLESSGFALVSEEVDLGAQPEGDLVGDLGDIARVRVVVEGGPIFVGIGPEREVRGYLRGVRHDEVVDVDFDPFRPEYEAQAGTRAPARPGAQDFWVERSQGQGFQRIDWDLREGSWVLVVMNADGSPGVSALVSLGLRVTHLLAIILILLLVGLALLGGGITMMVFAARRRGPAEDAAAVAGRGPTRHPLRIEGALDPRTSRALWLVKWLLAIPHFLLLLAFGLAFFVVSVIAFFAILFTGRYPRALFDFNLGVLRWSWRVAFYSYGVLGTDRYPPFTFGPAPDYPATLDLDYPEELSRGLALVKWWLLAIPHYLVLVILGGGIGSVGIWIFADGGSLSVAWGGGLIGLLVLVAAVVLLFRKRYPRDIFELVMGLQRWSFRVIVYAALMRDEYPPFRLDMGGREPPPETDLPGTERDGAG